MGVENIEEWDVPVGRVVSTWDRALLKIKSYREVPGRFDAGAQFCVVVKDEPHLIAVKDAKRGGGGWILDVGLNASAEAEAFKGVELLIHPSMRPPLPPGEFYLDDMLGMRVTTETGEELGEIEEVFETPANNVYATPLAMIPAINEFIIRTDWDERVLVVRDVPGLKIEEDD